MREQGCTFIKAFAISILITEYLGKVYLVGKDISFHSKPCGEPPWGSSQAEKRLPPPRPAVRIVDPIQGGSFAWLCNLALPGHGGPSLLEPNDSWHVQIVHLQALEALGAPYTIKCPSLPGT